MPDHQNIQRWHGCFGRGDNNVIGPHSGHECFESIYSPVQEENPEMFLLHAGWKPVLWMLDDIFQAAKCAQESEMGLEIRHVDQRRHLMFSDGKGRGKLGWIIGVGRRGLFASFRRCRGRGWETNLVNVRHGVVPRRNEGSPGIVRTFWRALL